MTLGDERSIRYDDGVVGYVPGVFDLFHIGHLNVLRSAAQHCDLVVAGVLTDDLCEVRKGFRPTVPLEERLEIVSSIKGVETAVVEDDSKVAMWRRVGFDVLVKGDDWQGTPAGDRLESDMRSLGVDVVYLPYTPMTSSSHLRAALRVVAGIA